MTTTTKSNETMRTQEEDAVQRLMKQLTMMRITMTMTRMMMTRMRMRDDDDNKEDNKEKDDEDMGQGCERRMWDEDAG